MLASCLVAWVEVPYQAPRQFIKNPMTGVAPVIHKLISQSYPITRLSVSMDSYKADAVGLV